MRIRNYVLALLLSVGLTASAGNKKTSVSQVTNSVTLTEDVDYVITGTTPFTTSGSVNIESTDHAVVIISNIKPSKVISNWLSSIYIKGEKAVNDVNCQVKMYNKGAIIFPYDKNFKPLTCYTEENFEGESCDNYSEGSSGGFMKTLTAATLNNNFKSFKLKRGYMVTFALGTAGWGYSRCFIADQEDLEMNLPANMIGRVSSYRLFKWQNAKKAGIASDTRYEATNATNASWCYSWGTGENRYPDTECVPNHIYEDWPSASACGSVDYSCHMKTNNEPGNSADDRPQDVSTVLANWQNLMRTGMRLCSESSHDGSMSHLKAFIDSIDTYGWRCDILDLHCYWASGTFNSLEWYSSNYGNGRPIWISEWVWGASWNNNGIFGAVSNKDDYSTANQQTCYNGTKPILDLLNSLDIVERYAYWNSEAASSKIYKDGNLSILGRYYAEMNDGLGYKAAKQYVPKVVYKAPTSLSGSYAKASNEFKLTWKDDNGDMLDSMAIEVKLPGTTVWRQVSKVNLKDKSAASGASYSYSYPVEEVGAYYFRIAAYPIGNKTPRRSAELAVASSKTEGLEGFQFGKLNVTNLDALQVDFTSSFEAVPAVFMGLCTNKNATLYPSNLITSVSKSKFSYQILPWQYQSVQTTSISNAEEIPFMALPEGNYNFGGLDAEVGVTLANMKDTAVVTFQKPFPEGVTPIVLCEIRNPINKSVPAISQVWDVTNTGFKCILMYEEGYGKVTALNQNVCYFAITPGFGTVNEEAGLQIYAGTGETYGIIQQQFLYKVGEESLYLYNPYVFAKCQTKNYPAGAVLRRSTDAYVTDRDEEKTKFCYGTFIKRQVDGTSTTTAKNNKTNPDVLGIVVLATAHENGSIPTSIVATPANGDQVLPFTPTINNGVVMVDGTDNFELFSVAGAKLNSRSQLNAGTYIVKSGNHSVKIVVK
ncbi:MAG: hypothetical protein IJR86_07115 [Bacteroidaceae bacterium]|nr:hypothetical protein [Bacteroidaceae bacterium]